ncbi:ATP-binding cassette, subfamily B [Lachnospiraceae bacterium A10]|nr:ATP-binding cassette, subfamily B [Lachnospiraceae bacterium A10]
MLFESLKRKYALSDSGVKHTKKAIFWTIVVNLVVMGGMGILYFMMKEYMDTYISGGKSVHFLPYVLMVIVFFVISFATHFQQYRSTYSLVYGDVKEVRLTLAERLRKLPLGYFGKRDVADLTETLLSDVNRLEHVWSHCLGYLYGSYISTAIVAVMVFLFDWRMAIACLWGVPVAFLLLFGSRSIAKKLSEDAKHGAIQVSEGMQEIIENVREIRASNREEDFLQSIDAKIDNAERLQLRNELLSGIFINGASVIMRLGVATTILVGVQLIAAGEIDFIVFFMFMLLITRVYAPFDQALCLIAEMLMSQVSANRLVEIQEMQTAEGITEFDTNHYSIHFDDVYFSYDNDDVLKGVSFTAKEGEVTALVGPSGSGKSTCARLAARLWDIDKGSITVGNVDINTVDPEVLLKDYSVVFQDVVLFDDTVMENIRLGRRGATDEEVLAAAKAANCDEFVLKLPDGYATEIGENGAKLSGGERQRISIARALLKNAPIVLLDEATASLDVENETKVQSALSRLLKGKTVLVIAHRMRTVEAADHIVVLDRGEVVEEGSPAELLQKDGMFKHMSDLQMESEAWAI